jgi:hypothetical protein
MSIELFMVEVCRYMGWDYWEYIRQPSWFIDLIATKMNVDTEHEIRNAKRAHNG